MRGVAAFVVVAGIAGGLVWLAESPAAWVEPIGAAQTRALRLRLAAGQMVAVGVGQAEIDLTLAAEYPDGRWVEGSDRGEFGREVLLFATDLEGEYTVHIQANATRARKGGYWVNLLEIRRVRESDHGALKAQSLFVQAADLERRASAENQERARKLYGEAAALFLAGGYDQLAANAKNFEGRALDRTSRREAAYACYQEALRIRRRIGDEYGQMESLQQIGRLSGHLKEHFSFVPDDEQSLQWWQRTGDRRGIAHAMSVVSSFCRRQRKNLTEAVGWAERSVRLAHEIEDRPLESRCLESLVAAQAEARQFDGALVNAERILAIERELGDARSEAASLGRIGLILKLAERDAEAIPYLRRQVELQRTLGDATGLTESLSFLSMVYRRMGDERAAAELQKEEVKLHFQVAGDYASAKWRSAYLASAANIDVVSSNLIAAGRVQDAWMDVDRLRAEGMGMRAMQAAPALLAELGDGTILIEILLGRQRSYVWRASRAGVRVHEVPDEKRMTALATRVWNCYAQRKECGPEARELSRILFGPGWAEMRGKRLVISGDGILSYLPLGALPEPAGQSDEPILARQEVVQAPSLTVIAALRRQGGAARGSPEVTVVADPVYDRADARLAGHEAAPAPDREAVRAMDIAGVKQEGGRIPRLWHTEAEVKAVFDALPKPVRRVAYTGFDATRAALLRPVARGSILHIATHSFVNEEDPEMSGLVLSLFGPDGRPVDGYVRLREVGAMSVPARLIVLSACETARGRQYFGQGAFSLASAFLRAGAKAVVASNWKVSDEATTELMRLFYGRLMPDAEMRAPAALRAAQMELRKNPKWALPYFWAAFAAHGEWR